MHRSALAADCVKVADDLTAYLGISDSFWPKSCAVLGEQAAAVCVGLINYAVHREDKAMHKPIGYIRSMLRKAESGELHRHNSLFAMFKRGGE